MTTRTPDEKPETDQDDPKAAIRACSKALIHAVHIRDEAGVSEALADAFAILESMPHEEAGETPSPHTYESQND